MKTKLLVVFLLLLGSGPLLFGRYNHYRFDLVNVSLYRGAGFPATSRQTIRDTYLELEGFHRHKIFDMYWFIDFADINNSPANDTHDSDAHFYTELQPRISIDGLLGEDLSFWRFKEWFLSYELDMNDDHYGGGLRYHNIGIGTDIAVDGFYYFRGNLFARYIQQDYGNPAEGHLDGCLLNFSWGTKICDLRYGLSLNTTGWMDLVFLARQSSLKPGGRDTCIQGMSQIILRKGRWGVSFALKFSDGFGQTCDTPYNATNSIARIVGLTCTFQK